MLTERPIHQPSDSRRRRLFCDKVFDLFVWFETDGRIHGFQLLYRLPGYPFLSVLWTPDSRWQYHKLVSGEGGSAHWDGGTGMSPSGPEHFDKARLMKALAPAAEELEETIREFVLGSLRALPDRMLICGACHERRVASAVCDACEAKVCRACAKRLGEAPCPKTVTPPYPYPGKRHVHYWSDRF